MGVRVSGGGVAAERRYTLEALRGWIHMLLIVSTTNTVCFRICMSVDICMRASSCWRHVRLPHRRVP